MKHREQIAEEEYSEALKDAERIHKKTTENPRAKDVMSELIEKQIKQAAQALEYAYYQIGKMQEREKSTPEEKTLGYLSEYCERLLQIVQNQQAQIEGLREAQKGMDEMAKAHLDDDPSLYDQRRITR